MMSDHNNSDLAPQRQEMYVENVSSGLIPQGQKASDYDNSDPVPPRQNVVPTAEKTDSLQQGWNFSLVLYLKNITIPLTVMMGTTTMIKHRMHRFKKLNLSILFVHGYKKLVKQKPGGIFISQDKYVAGILKKFDFCSIKTATTPIESNKPLVKDEDGVDVDVHIYRSMIGSLMYLTTSRPDIMFAVCACARDSPFDLEAFSDSDYGGANLDRKSTIEAEYVAAANCCGQVLWIQNQMMDYGFNFMNTKIHIDNESTICIVKNPIYHSRTKHIEIRHHFIRDCYEKRLIDVVKIHTDNNIADLLTKGFDVIRFNFLVVSIGMLNL
ncbi:hypothetical protein Tco_1452251 [Tanacetum coccineum]